MPLGLVLYSSVLSSQSLLEPATLHSTRSWYRHCKVFLLASCVFKPLCSQHIAALQDHFKGDTVKTQVNTMYRIPVRAGGSDPLSAQHWVQLAGSGQLVVGVHLATRAVALCVEVGLKCVVIRSILAVFNLLLIFI